MTTGFPLYVGLVLAPLTLRLLQIWRLGDG